MEGRPNLNARFILYSSDGFGRDTYINFNNGGMWKDFTVKAVNKFDRPKNSHMPSLK
jgi:hypothetical protein